ncbi:hypothetical protein Scep_012673 [Stephania cephalantha]|uniref:Uncharacterized protein n=1 Tax=Stephania cephalantha TaxID=152367 RepID=A0AAP0JGE0_9MAGN
MLSRLLHVRLPTAKQAVITAIDLLGCAVITAAESGASFPLKRRDLMLDYILTLMGREESDGYPGSNLELLHTGWFIARCHILSEDLLSICLACKFPSRSVD